MDHRSNHLDFESPKTATVHFSNGTEKEGKGSASPEPVGGFAFAVFDWLELFAISLSIVLLLMSFVVRHSPVIGASMEPTVVGSNTTAVKNGEPSDVMLISKLFYTPKTGDVVVINSPHNFEEPIIKRVIAVGGQTVEIHFNTWETYVDGKKLEEPYLTTSIPETYSEGGVTVTRETNPNLFDKQSGHPMQDYGMDTTGTGVCSFTVPEGSVFVMGDHRNNSKDSRILGCIDERYILGKVLWRIYPFSRFGALT